LTPHFTKGKIRRKARKGVLEVQGVQIPSLTLQKGGEKKRKSTPQNKFKILASRVMRCGVELRRQEMKEERWRVECYKCGEEGHKCRECPL